MAPATSGVARIGRVVRFAAAGASALGALLFLDLLFRLLGNAPIS